MQRMSEDGVITALKALPEWKIEDGCLTLTRTFADFAGAMRFVNEAADLAEAMAHHPDLDIRYNKVRIALTTHDAGGITQLDLKLAAALDAL